MTSMRALESLVGSIQLPIPLPETRFVAYSLEPPYFPPPYSSVFDDVMAQNAKHIADNRLRRAALRPVTLQAGKAPMPGGELGRPAARHPVMLPELPGGRLLYTNI